MSQIHLWTGVTATVLVIVISITGIIWNRLAGAMPMIELVSAAEAVAGDEIAAAGVDRLNFRPDKGLMKVRFGDRLTTEVTLAIHTGEVLSMGTRDDVFLEKLHSGEIFGDNWILVSDALAIGLLILLLTGAWIWLYPKART